jgi:hypothetical protein
MVMGEIRCSANTGSYPFDGPQCSHTAREESPGEYRNVEKGSPLCGMHMRHAVQWANGEQRHIFYSRSDKNDIENESGGSQVEPKVPLRETDVVPRSGPRLKRMIWAMNQYEGGLIPYARTPVVDRLHARFPTLVEHRSDSWHDGLLGLEKKGVVRLILGPARHHGCEIFEAELIFTPANVWRAIEIDIINNAWEPKKELTLPSEELSLEPASTIGPVNIIKPVTSVLSAYEGERRQRAIEILQNKLIATRERVDELEAERSVLIDTIAKLNMPLVQLEATAALESSPPPPPPPPLPVEPIIADRKGGWRKRKKSS